MVPDIQPSEVKVRYLPAKVVDDAGKRCINAMRIIQEFGAPGMIAVRHQLPQLTHCRDFFHVHHFFKMGVLQYSPLILPYQLTDGAEAISFYSEEFLTYDAGNDTYGFPR